MMKKVLILSNGTFDEYFYRDRLEIDNKYEVVIANSLEEYENYFNKHDFDVLIVDYFKNQYSLGELAQICNVKATVKFILADISMFEEDKLLRTLGVDMLSIYNPNDKPKRDFVENIDAMLEASSKPSQKSENLLVIIVITLIFLIILGTYIEICFM